MPVLGTHNRASIGTRVPEGLALLLIRTGRRDLYKFAGLYGSHASRLDLVSKYLIRVGKERTEVILPLSRLRTTATSRLVIGRTPAGLPRTYRLRRAPTLANLLNRYRRLIP